MAAIKFFFCLRSILALSFSAGDLVLSLVALRRLEFGDVGLFGRRKIEEPKQKPSKQGENQTATSSTRV